MAYDSFGCFDTPYCFVGHTHSPVIFRMDGEHGINGEERSEPTGELSDGSVLLGSQRLIINPGSVGQPRDGDSRAGYVLLDVEARTLVHRRVPYPIGVTQEKMIGHGLPARLVLRLRFGW
jgi:predicted phosphodiesterase